MKKFFVFVFCFMLAMPVLAVDKNSEVWKGTTLSDETIESIQKAKYKYMQCITVEVQKQEYVKMDTRVATDKILQHCEKSLSHVKKVLNEAKVPESVISRYLKQIRTQTARMVLQQLMLEDAARKSGAK